MVSGGPFREEDALARVQALELRRQAIAAELEFVQQAIATLQPWSWRSFVFGVSLLPLALLLVVIALVR